MTDRSQLHDEPRQNDVQAEAQRGAFLVARAQAGDRDAFAELAGMYHVRLFTFLARRLRSRTDAEDLCQLVLLRAWTKLDTFQLERGTPFSAWLFTVANRLAITERRHEKPLRALADCDPADRRNHDPAAALTRHESRRRLWELVDHVLSPDAAASVWLRYGEGLAIPDIANVLAWSGVRVRVTLFRARAELLRALRSEGDDFIDLPSRLIDAAPRSRQGASYAPAS